MDERVSQLVARVDELSKVVADLERRVAAVEAAPAELSSPVVSAYLSTAAPGGGGHGAGAPVGTPAEAPALPGMTLLAGRTLVILSGAFLLRALADSGALSQAAAAGFGLAFAAIWLAASDRAARLAHELDALVHGATAAAIAFPLIGEATVRFHAFTPSAAAGLLVLATLAGVTTSARRRQRVLASGFALAGLVTGVVLLFATREVAPCVVAIALVTLAVVEVSYRRDWPELRRAFAVLLDVLWLVLLVAHAKDRAPWVSPGVVLALVCGLAVFEITFFLIGTLGRGWRAQAFELGQLLVAVALAWWGGGFVAERAGWPSWPLGLSALVLSAGSWSLGLGVIEPRQGRGVNASAFVALGLLFAFEGMRQLLPPAAAIPGWAGLCLVAAWCGEREGRTTLRIGAGALAIAVGGVSGLAGLASALRSAGERGALAAPDVGVGAALLLCGSAYVVLRGKRTGARATRSWTLPGLALALVTAWGAAGFLGGLVAWAAPVVGGDAGLQALVRTVLLLVVALGLALAHRAKRLPELGWATWATLALVGAKFVVDDLRHGRPATLFPALVLLGSALIFAPRLLKARSA